MPEALRKYRSYLGGLVALALLGAAYWVNVFRPWSAVRDKATPAALNLVYAQSWAWTVVLIVAFMALVGIALNNRPAGVLIDARNRVSLSRMQMVAWTVLVISALATGVTARIISGGGVVPLDITIPGELLAAMGIAVTSLVAAPALVSLKTDAPAPAQTTIDDGAARTGRNPAAVNTAGHVVGFESPKLAQWLDMFRGDTAETFGTPDLSKIQQFLVTVVLIGVYAGAIWQAFVDGAVLLGPPDKDTVTPFLPALDSDFIWLLGISHAGYLAYKAAPKSAPPPSGTTMESPEKK